MPSLHDTQPQYLAETQSILLNIEYGFGLLKFNLISLNSTQFNLVITLNHPLSMRNLNNTQPRHLAETLSVLLNIRIGFGKKQGKYKRY